MGKRAHGIIADTYVRSVEEGDVALDATETPEILVFQVRTVTVPIDLHGNLVLPGFQIIRNVEFRSFHTALAVPHTRAVHPDIKGTHDTVKA